MAYRAGSVVKMEWHLTFTPFAEGQSFSQQIVSEIAALVRALEPQRRVLFLRWLSSHGCQITNEREIEKSLTTWFDSMDRLSIHCEYFLILIEIKWWRDLDETSLTRMSLSQIRRRE
jgi:hypothetical protein